MQPCTTLPVHSTPRQTLLALRYISKQAPFNGVLPSSFPSPNNVPINVTGTLDITGISILSGSLHVAPYGLITSLAGPTLGFYTIMDSLNAGYQFTSSGPGFFTTGPGVSNCVGPAAALICAPAIAGAPPISYVLTSSGANTYWLTLTSGDNVSHTWQTFSLTASPLETPIPATSWLFASGMFGLVGAARRRKK